MKFIKKLYIKFINKIRGFSISSKQYRDDVNMIIITSVCKLSLAEVKADIEKYIDKEEMALAQSIMYDYGVDTIKELKSGLKYNGIFKFERNCLLFKNTVGDNFKKTLSNIMRKIADDLNKNVNGVFFKFYYTSKHRSLIKFVV